MSQEAELLGQHSEVKLPGSGRVPAGFQLRHLSGATTRLQSGTLMRPFSRNAVSVKYKNGEIQPRGSDVIFRAQCKVKTQVLCSKSIKNFKTAAAKH